MGDNARELTIGCVQQTRTTYDNKACVIDYEGRSEEAVKIPHRSKSPNVRPEENPYDDDDGSVMIAIDDDVRDDEDRTAARQCCGETRLNWRRTRLALADEASAVRHSASKVDCKKAIGSYFSRDNLKRRLPIVKWAPSYRWVTFTSVYP